MAMGRNPQYTIIIAHPPTIYQHRPALLEYNNLISQKSGTSQDDILLTAICHFLKGVLYCTYRYLIKDLQGICLLKQNHRVSFDYEIMNSDPPVGGREK